jgi:hypothetical protein
MSSQVHSTTAFDDCTKYLTFVKNMVSENQGSIPFPPRHLPKIHAWILEVRSHFEASLRVADAFACSMTLADEAMSRMRGAPSQDYSRNIPQKKWNPNLVQTYPADLRDLYVLERRVRYAKEGKEFFDLPIVSPKMLSIYRSKTIARILWIQAHKEQ